MLKNFFLVADDFGLAESINEGIICAFKAGVLTKTSLMVNAKYCDHALTLTKKHPGLKVGLHLTLIEEKPCLEAYKVKTLIDKRGYFHKNILEFGRKYFSGHIHLKEIYKELDEQFKCFLNKGLTIDHINSHCHLHVIPKVLDIVIDLAKKYRVKYIRSTYEPIWLIKNSKRKRIFFQLILNMFSYFAKKKIKENRLKTSEIFLGFSSSGNLSENILKKYIDCPSKGSIEIMCHPGYESQKLILNYGHWQYHWQKELTAILSLKRSIPK